MFHLDETEILEHIARNDEQTRKLSSMTARRGHLFGASVGLFDRSIDTNIQELSDLRSYVVEKNRERKAEEQKDREQTAAIEVEQPLIVAEGESQAQPIKEVLTTTEWVTEEVPPQETVEEPKTWELHNWWTSRRLKNGKLREVTIYKCKETGEYKHEIENLKKTFSDSKLDLLIESLDVSSRYYSLKAEKKARRKLLKMLRPMQLHDLTLTGTFTEGQTKSGMVYLLRLGRPTLAFRIANKEDNSLNFVAALCSHGVSYYSGTYAGFVVPSDELISHLVSIRSDEYNFWKKSNHHSHRVAGAGI